MGITRTPELLAPTPSPILKVFQDNSLTCEGSLKYNISVLWEIFNIEVKKGFSIGDLFEIFAIPHAAQKRYHNIGNLVVAGTAIFHAAASIRVNQVTLKDAAILQNDFEFQAEKLVWTSGTVRGSKPQVGIL